MTKTEQRYPWQLSYDAWKVYEVASNKKLIAVTKQLAARLGKSSGHKEAQLYLDWAHKIGKEATKKFWHELSAD